jgi:hypothetical protein
MIARGRVGWSWILLYFFLNGRNLGLSYRLRESLKTQGRGDNWRRYISKGLVRKGPLWDGNTY